VVHELFFGTTTTTLYEEQFFLLVWSKKKKQIIHGLILFFSIHESSIFNSFFIPKSSDRIFPQTHSRSCFTPRLGVALRLTFKSYHDFFCDKTIRALRGGVGWTFIGVLDIGFNFRTTSSHRETEI
jgi:hypothetical protein